MGIDTAKFRCYTARAARIVAQTKISDADHTALIVFTPY